MLAFLQDAPPTLCDWLPWNHTFGASHFGMVLYNGGTLYIDDGQPVRADGPRSRTSATWRPRNQRAARIRAAAAVLREDESFCRHFFSHARAMRSHSTLRDRDGMQRGHRLRRPTVP